MGFLKDLIPFHFEQKSNEIIINTDNFKEGECKIVPVWSWAKLRRIKYAVCYNGGKIEISEIK
ncbi:MAG: hypothetical protein KKD69_02495 [Euryarchaeota archaeon]|nr:hypothetical protein [Euryarchaeota archaeon]MCG2728557.1 hypothetical protein [Candidatus Methanoperedenaceae archaeon]